MRVAVSFGDSGTEESAVAVGSLVFWVPRPSGQVAVRFDLVLQAVLPELAHIDPGALRSLRVLLYGVLHVIGHRSCPYPELCRRAPVVS